LNLIFVERILAAKIFLFEVSDCCQCKDQHLAAPHALPHVWMLPYRLRPPVYGGKLKQQKDKESFLERTYPYREGGPVERAVKADLQALFPRFKVTVQEHAPLGNAFRVFKDVFGSAKVAMLHRSGVGFLLQRCDRNAYSQLLYAVCLSLLRDSFRKRDSSDAFFLRRAAFAVFSLYALYETNPLPQGPTDGFSKEEWLAMLPMGLQNRENPKTIYRRAFRHPVRIDPEHFSYLLRLRDLASATCCRCEATRMRIESLQSMNHNVEGGSIGDESLAWMSELAVATDLGVVLDRILSSNMLEFCAYPGPCGLEGLAGHPDYAFPATGVSKSPAPSFARGSAMNNSASGTTPLSQLDDSINGGVAATNNVSPLTFSPSLEEHLQQYLSSRQALRLPAMGKGTSQQATRIRETLLPIFPQDSGQNGSACDPVSRLLSTCRGEEEVTEAQQTQTRIKLRHRHVSFGAVVVNDGMGSATPLSAEAADGGDSLVDERQSIATNPENQVATHPDNAHSSYELILPSHLAARQQESLHAAVQTLLDRDESLLLLLSGGAETTLSQFDDMTKDGVSTLGNGDVSAGGSSLTGAGRGALRALLAQAQSAPSPLVGTSLNPNCAGDFFLTSTSTKTAGSSKKAPVDDDGYNLNVSDLSSEDELDQVSVAASQVGQSALQALLATAGHKSRHKPQKPRPTTSRKPAATRKVKRKRRSLTQDGVESDNDSSEFYGADRGSSVLDSLLAKPSQPPKAAERTPSGDESDTGNSESSSLYSESVDRGRTALDALLASAMLSNGKK
jgi:hypothetical protein